MPSIERRLLTWIIGAMTIGSALLLSVTYLVTLDEMNEVYDADLQNIADAMASYHEFGHGPSVAPPAAVPQPDAPDESGIVTLMWTPTGHRLYASDASAPVPYIATEGLTRPHVGGEDWIVYTSVTGDVVAQAAQRRSARRAIAGESAARALPPALVLVLAVGATLVFGLRRSLRPLDRAARDVAARSASSLAAIEVADVPIEVRPLVLSLNDLMSRLAAAFSAQRRFLADAAHELRTPVTALRLQLQLLERSTDGISRQRALRDLGAGIDRSQRLIEQLLSLSSAEPDDGTMPMKDVDLGELVRSVVGEMNIKAEAMGLDLGADAPHDIIVQGQEHPLRILLINLVENALRYTPAGGVVDVRACIEGAQPTLQVIDDGPGIPQADRVRVFDRFHRGDDAPLRARDGAGSGLGLAIVRAIAERHHASVGLYAGRDGRGLDVRVIFTVVA